MIQTQQRSSRALSDLLKYESFVNKLGKIANKCWKPVM